MSRSRARKFRFCRTNTAMKRVASKKVRRNRWFNTVGNLYKRLFQSWNINDSGRAKPIPKKENNVDIVDNDWKAKAKRK